MPNERLARKEKKRVTLTREGALHLIEVINDMRQTQIWRYPAYAALHNNNDPKAYRKFKQESSGYTLPHRLFPDHQLEFTALWAQALKDKVKPVASHSDIKYSRRENHDANWIAGLLVLLSQIHKGQQALPTTISQEQ